MEYEKLAHLIFTEMKPKLENHQGLLIFARERAKFEGWLKVELTEILSRHFDDVLPEKDRIDVTFGKWAIELKTVNTNIRFDDVKAKTRPITKNTQGVIEDIEKLKMVKYENKAVLFLVFPITHENGHWQTQLERISKLLNKLVHERFSFGNGIPGVIYFGLI